MASTSKDVKKQFVGKKENNVVFGQRIRIKNDCHQSVGVVLISNPTPVQRPQQSNNQQRPDVPKRQITRINMPLLNFWYQICDVEGDVMTQISENNATI